MANGKGQMAEVESEKSESKARVIDTKLPHLAVVRDDGQFLVSRWTG